MLEIINGSKNWDLKTFEPVANDAVQSTLIHLNCDPNKFEIAILTCNDRRILELNNEFRGIEKETNILSWPERKLSSRISGDMPIRPRTIDQSPVFLGNLAISYQFTVNEANELNRDFYQHVFHLISHGTLHLLGFVHELELDAKIMEKVEIEILAKAGISDPYISE